MTYGYMLCVEMWDQCVEWCDVWLKASFILFQGETTVQQTALCSMGLQIFSGSAPWSWWRTPASRSFRIWWLIVRTWTGTPLSLAHVDQLTDMGFRSTCFCYCSYSSLYYDGNSEALLQRLLCFLAQVPACRDGASFWWSLGWWRMQPEVWRLPPWQWWEKCS